MIEVRRITPQAELRVPACHETLGLSLQAVSLTHRQKKGIDYHDFVGSLASKESNGPPRVYLRGATTLLVTVFGEAGTRW